MNEQDSGSATSDSSKAPPNWYLATAGGAVASAIAMAGMALLRASVQVRTLPERVMEWLLLFVPLDLFEAALRRFGFEAKRYALYGAIVGMFLLLAALGVVVLRRRWSSLAIVALGLGLWLFTMVIIMPLTNAGFFTLSLINGSGTAVMAYLAVALTYAATLACSHALFQQDPAQPTSKLADVVVPDPHGRTAARRSAVVMAGGALASFGVTFAADRRAPRSGLTQVVMRDPQQPFPSGGIDRPQPHPNSVATQQPDLARDPSSLEPRGTQAGAPNGSSSLEPPPAVVLARDKDGAVLPSGRRAGQLAEAITPNSNFYIVTKNAGGDPVLRLGDWRLRIDGEVQRPIELDYRSLRQLPAVEVTKTIECISNLVTKCELASFGCDLISTARWKGARLTDVVALAGGVKPGATVLATFAADEFTTALPIEVALAPDTLLVYEMNGQVLPREHGYPVRMLVPGRYGMKSAKWVVALRAMRRDFADWYGQRDWSKQGIVRTMTRIDVPAAGAVLAPGDQRIAGIAYGGDRGVAKVEFSADGGTTWDNATFLELPPSRDCWVRWEGSFELAPGSEVTLAARATDGAGAVQIEAFSLAQPDGGSGWHTIDARAKRG